MLTQHTHTHTTIERTRLIQHTTTYTHALPYIHIHTYELSDAFFEGGLRDNSWWDQTVHM